MRQKLLLVAAVFFGILAFVLSYQQINAEKAKIRESTVQMDVVALKKDLTVNEEIKEEHIVAKRVTHFKDDKANSDIPWAKRNQIIGRKVTSAYYKGDVLTWHAIDVSTEESGRTGLTAKIEMEKVAVAIPVDAISSLNGLIRPNNHVDVIGTFTDPKSTDNQRALITMTLMQDIRVLACGADMGYQDAGRGFTRSYGTITLEVTPEQAKILIFAQRLGRLSLILRPPDSIPELDLKQIKWKNFEDYNSKRTL